MSLNTTGKPRFSHANGVSTQGGNRPFLLLLLIFLLVLAVVITWIQNREDLTSLPLWSYYISRLITAFGVGGSLALAGCILQSLFQNPLTEPFTLGLSSGAALFCVLSVYFGFTSATSTWSLGLPAALGATAVIVPLLWFGRSSRFRRESFLLLGLAIHFLGASAVSLVTAIDQRSSIQGALMWLLGDLSRAELFTSVPLLLAAFGVTIGFMFFHRKLDVLLLGELPSRNLGLNFPKVRFFLLLPATLLTAAAVALSGIVGFVGLLGPHIARRIFGPNHRWLLPASFIAGGNLVVWADLISRWSFYPIDIPVGVVTGLIGSPLFLLLLLKKNSFQTAAHSRSSDTDFLNQNAESHRTSRPQPTSPAHSSTKKSVGVELQIDHIKVISPSTPGFISEALLVAKDVTLASGHIVGIFGPNGSGKSTFFRALCDLLEGDLELSDLDAQIVTPSEKIGIRELSRIKRSQLFSYVFLENKPEFPITVEDFIALGDFCHSDQSDRRSNASVESLLSAYSLYSLRNQTVQTLSHGQWALAILCRAFLQNPQILVIDELLSPLDLNHQIEAIAHLKHWLKEDPSRFVFLVSHELRIIEQNCDEVVLYKKGELFAKGTVKDHLNEATLAKLFDLDPCLLFGKS